MTYGTQREDLKPRILSTNDLILVNILLLFVAQTWILVFYSIRTVENRDIQYLVADHTCLDISNIINLINLSIIGKKCGTTKKTSRWTYQSLLLRKASFVLMFSSTLTARETIK